MFGPVCACRVCHHQRQMTFHYIAQNGRKLKYQSLTDWQINSLNQQTKKKHLNPLKCESVGSQTTQFSPLRFRWLLPLAGRRAQTDRQKEKENADTLAAKWTHGEKKQQTREPAECEQLFQARSRHGNSSSLQSRAYLRAIRATKKKAAAQALVVYHQLFKRRVVWVHERLFHTWIDVKKKKKFRIFT